ncbi:uncharacterized protein LOC143040891 [Oratosquilla oratoria]|uniref:uncharacterized protein LOC143040891 n=1 Tax=Oratosquilla oratoria TaxID=337810 RepID=UPI003F7730C6
MSRCQHHHHQQQWTWAAVALAVVLGLLSASQMAEGKPDPTQLAAMADALKYLQELDKYYSQVARPSTRSIRAPTTQLLAMEKALRYLQLQELGKLYSERSRPRFGKRSEGPTSPLSNDALLEASERLLENLRRRRR